MIPALNFFCAISFLGYGLSCLLSDHMVREFERYGLVRFRVLTGTLQLLGGAGLLVGFQFPLIGAIAAGGLALQMLCGFGVRLRIRDPWFLCLPALGYFVISALLCRHHLGELLS